MNYNLNDRVKVILTEDGAFKLNEEIMQHYKNLGNSFSHHWYNAGEVYETQLWQLMSKFGPHITITSPQFFENNNIELE